jgi:hypothetical protein
MVMFRMVQGSAFPRCAAWNKTAHSVRDLKIYKSAKSSLIYRTIAVLHRRNERRGDSSEREL